LTQPINNLTTLTDKANPSTGIEIDIKRVIFRALRFWYLVLASVVTCLAIAFLVNRYAIRIYPVSASIIIKESQESSSGKLLYNNPLVSYYRNYLNELYIIRSYPLIERTIDNLDFESTFYLEGNVLTSEAYRMLPVKAYVKRD
jgi:uncharacterized protein involved in exopolysaccharide biosynthesis